MFLLMIHIRYSMISVNRRQGMKAYFANSLGAISQVLHDLCIVMGRLLNLVARLL